MTAKSVVIPPRPVITVTGTEELQFPARVKEVEADATSPVGTLELEIIELLESDEDESGEDGITGEEMCRRAKAKQADLGLRHALAFLAKYRKEKFGLLVETCIPFPGTVVVDEDDLRRIPCLTWGGGAWYLSWKWLGVDWNGCYWKRNARLIRPRASA